MARTFATNPPPPPFQNPSGAGSRVDQFLIAAAKDFEQKLKNQIIMLPNEYFLTMEKLFKMLDDPRNGTLSKEESVAAAIFLSVMLANSAPKLAPLEFVRSVTFLYHMTREIGFRLSAEHMKNIMFAIKDPLPKEIERVVPFFLRILTRIHDPAATETVRPRVGSLSDQYIQQHKDELKVQEITAILESWMQVGYKNDEVFKIMKEHITKYHKLLIFDPNDIHILLYFETTQVKDHDKSYINVLVSKAKDQVGSLDIFLLTNLLAFKKALAINDPDLEKGIIDAIRAVFNEEKPQLSPLVYTQLLMAVNDMGGKKNRDLIEKLVKHFINDKEILAVPQNWTPLHMYLLMLGVESANIADKEFTAKAATLLEKLMPSISPELLVPIAKLLARGKFAKQEKIVKAYVDAFKKIDAVKEKDPARSSEKAKVKVAITAIMSENPLAKMK